MTLEEDILNTINDVEAITLPRVKYKPSKHRVKLDLQLPDKHLSVPEDVLQGIQEEMKSLDPDQAKRLYFVRTHYRNKRKEYNKRAYNKRKRLAHRSINI